MTTKNAGASVGETQQPTEAPSLTEIPASRNFGHDELTDRITEMKKHDAPVLGPPLPRGRFEKVQDPRERVRSERQYRAEGRICAEEEAVRAVARWTYGVQSEITFTTNMRSDGARLRDNYSEEFPRFRPEIVAALWSGQEMDNDGRDPMVRLSDREAAVVELIWAVFSLEKEIDLESCDFNEFVLDVFEWFAAVYIDPENVPVLRRAGVVSPDDAAFVDLVQEAVQILRRHGSVIIGLRDVFAADVSDSETGFFSGAESWSLIERIIRLVEKWETGQKNSVPRVNDRGIGPNQPQLHQPHR